MKVVIAGGGTAGHVFPAIALGRWLAQELHADVRFLGTPDGLESRLVGEAGFAFAPVDARPLRRELSVAALTAPLTAVRSIKTCAPHVAGADVVVGMGGYVSVPAVLAAARARRPIVLHEQNAVPGIANRLLARWARTVALSFGEAAAAFPRRTRTVVTGNPVRESILAVPERREELAKEALDELGLEPGRRTVLVFGGSQGALRIGRAVAQATPSLADRDDLQLLVLLGPRNANLVDDLDGRSGLIVRAIAFLDRMELAYALADLVVARAGATSVAEISVCGLPSLLIPYPHATADHQAANAGALQRAGAAAVLSDEELTGPVFARRVAELLEGPSRLQAMARNARSWARPDAAGALAEQVRRAASA